MEQCILNNGFVIQDNKAALLADGALSTTGGWTVLQAAEVSPLLATLFQTRLPGTDRSSEIYHVRRGYRPMFRRDMPARPYPSFLLQLYQRVPGAHHQTTAGPAYTMGYDPAE